MSSSLLSFTNTLSIGQAWAHSYSSHSQKDIMFFSIHHQKHQGSFKLCMRPAKAIAHHCMLKTFVSFGSLGANETCEDNDTSYGLSNPMDFQRPKTIHDHPSNSSGGVSELERQLQELFDEVKRMIKIGNKKDAVDLLQANYEVVKEQIDANSGGIQEAATLDVIALGYMAIGDFKSVGSLLTMLSEVVNGLRDDEPLLDSVLMHMGSMHATLGNYEKSLPVYQRAVGILESRHGKNSAFLVSALLGMAKILGSIGRAMKAIEVYHRAISILELARGVESEDLVVPLYGLGNLFIKQGRVEDAQSPFLRIVRIYTNLYGENDGRVGMALSSLAHAKCATGNAEEAIDLYKKALQIIKDSNYVSLDDSIMAKMRIDLAELLHVVGRQNASG